MVKDEKWIELRIRIDPKCTIVKLVSNMKWDLFGSEMLH